MRVPTSCKSQTITSMFFNEPATGDLPASCVSNAHMFWSMFFNMSAGVFLRLAVKTVHRQLVMLVEITRDELPCLRVAADAVFRPVKCDEFHILLSAELRDDAVQMRIDAAGIGDQTNALATNQIELLGKQDFVAQFDARTRGGILFGCGCGGLAAGEKHGKEIAGNICTRS